MSRRTLGLPKGQHTAAAEHALKAVNNAILRAQEKLHAGDCYGAETAIREINYMTGAYDAHVKSRGGSSTGWYPSRRVGDVNATFSDFCIRPEKIDMGGRRLDGVSRRTRRRRRR